jgi:cell division protease FtsH
MADEPNNKPPLRGPTPPTPRMGRNLIGWIVFAVLAIVLMSWAMQNFDRSGKIDPTEFWGYLRNGQVKSLVIEQTQVSGELAAGIEGREKGASTKFYMPVNFEADRTFVERLVKEAPKETKWSFKEAPSWFEQVLPYVLLYGGLILLIWFMVFRRMGQAGAGAGFLGNFGRSKHRVLTKEHTNVTFADVAGVEEAKDEVGEIIEFLKNPRKFQRLGGRIPRGVLLVGEPGCGKTLLAKAIAGEAEVPFFSISGSDFVEMFVGVGASRVRDLFRSAKESSPCIIFLDEIDAVGRRRGAGFNGGGHDEREQTLNAILVEMDGFDTNDQVIVIAATNRMDVLDPALTRPGRFDRQIQVPLPDLKGRYDILKIYIGRIKASPTVDIQRLARATPMFSGADLAAMVNEAAIAATMANKDAVEQADLEEARDKVRWGRARKSRVVDEKEKEITAYHEAGHAYLRTALPEADPLHKVSIIPRGPAGGATFSLPEKDRHYYTKRWCDAFLRVSVAGRIAEEICLGDSDSGASGDISQATDLARTMVMDWGMSDKLGFVRYAPNAQRAAMLDLNGKDYSERTAETIDAEVKAIMDAAYADVRKLITENLAVVKRIAEALLKYETLDVDDVNKIISGKDLDKPSINDLFEKERTKVPLTEVAPHPGPAQPPGTVLPEPG